MANSASGAAAVATAERGVDRYATEFAKCAADPAYFTSTYCSIESPQSEGATIVPFELWPAQIDLITQMRDEMRLIILKARQLGISWVACAFALWTALFKQGQVILLFSKGQLEANELLRRVDFMYAHLPDWLHELLPYVVHKTTYEFELSNGSTMRSLPATPTAGRSMTASLIILDEFAFMQWASLLYASAKPAIDGGGRMIIVSTANGVGNLFEKMWHKAVAGLSNFIPHFLPWWAAPKRTAAWREQVDRDAEFSWMTAQEYPASPEEAFQASGVEKFLPDIFLWDKCREDLPHLALNEPVVLAADAGVSNDSFALLGVTRHPLRHDDVAVRHIQLWKPVRGIIDFQGPYDAIKELCSKGSVMNVINFSFDNYQMHFFASMIQALGLVITQPFNQNTDRLESDKQLLDLITQRRIAHDGNKDLRTHLENADRTEDKQSRKLRIVKRESALKIDLAVALSMASYRCLELPL